MSGLKIAGYENTLIDLADIDVGLKEIYIELTGKQYTSIYPQGMSDLLD